MAEEAQRKRTFWLRTCGAPARVGLLLGLALGAAPSLHAQANSAPTIAAARAAAQTEASAGALAVSTPHAAAPSTTAAVPVSGPTDSPKGASATLANAQKNAEANSNLEAQLAKLNLNDVKLDVPKRSKDVLTHLNSVLRYYREATSPIQKVGEPSDLLYAEQSSAQALQVAQLAFQAAKNEAALLSQVGSGKQTAKAPGSPSPSQGDDPSTASQSAPAQTAAQRYQSARAQAQAHIAALQAQEDTLEKQIATAKRATLPTLQQQLEQVEGGLQLQGAIVTALDRISSYSESQVNTGLAGDIERLQRSAPELVASTAATKAPPLAALQPLATSRDAGVTTQASTLFQLMSTVHTIDGQITALDTLRAQADDLRTPFLKVLRATIQKGQALTEQTVNLQATPTTDAQDLADTRKQFSELTNTFQVLAQATMPLSQEIVQLENSRGTLTTWRAAVNAEYKQLLVALLWRVFFIALALGVLALFSRLWNRATVKYIGDLRRRRQLLVVRRVVVGFLSGLVLIFGCGTQCSSLATFAGFISAGIAVGLQTILLSVAAYFFIIGRYGVRVGDRITVAGVTGDVIDVGLVRFYLMELAGTGTELHSTGRVAVFANSVLFQTGTPIYKQVPGTEYAWHELIAKLKSTADVPAVSAAVLDVINKVYAGYSAQILRQHRDVEAGMGTALPAPKLESRLQLTDTGLQFAVLFPVELQNAALTDQKIAENMLSAISSVDALKAGVVDLPAIKATVKS